MMDEKENEHGFFCVLRFGLSVLLCCVVACSRVRSRGPVPVPVLESINMEGASDKVLSSLRI